MGPGSKFQKCLSAYIALSEKPVGQTVLSLSLVSYVQLSHSGGGPGLQALLLPKASPFSLFG